MTGHFLSFGGGVTGYTHTYFHLGGLLVLHIPIHTAGSAALLVFSSMFILDFGSRANYFFASCQPVTKYSPRVLFFYKRHTFDSVLLGK
jgi:hypothetical protein